jgi:serine-type D-Ala-D-Ala carboxypeptidase (penicillin-binding protein 5/6)
MLSSGLKRFIWPLTAVILAFLAYLYLRPVPAVSPVSQIEAVPKTQPTNLPWPAAGQAAIGAVGYGVLAQHNTGTPVLIGSTAKVITALAVLKQKPISANGPGPTIALGQDDVSLFEYYYTHNGSVTNVANSEQISELQALQSMLIPSSNNMADSLAKWAFGSVDSYVNYANKMVKDMGLTNTHIADTNGFSDTTTSTASDLVKVGAAAMGNSVISQIVNQSSAQVPVMGTIKNTNYALGKDNIVGIKTGNTDKAGGCYIFASKRVIDGHQITVVGAVLGQPNLVTAINSASPILDSSDNGFEQVTVVNKNHTLGYYKVPWGAQAQFKSPKNLSLFVWKGADIRIENEPDTIGPSKSGTPIGRVTVASQQQSVSAPLILGQDLPGPSWHWRIIRK